MGRASQRRRTTSHHALAGIEANPQWTSDSHGIYFTRGTALQSPQTYLVQAAGSEEVKPLLPEHASRFASLGITPEIAHFYSKDGLALAGILYKPANFDAKKRYPAVISRMAALKDRRRSPYHPGPSFWRTTAMSCWILTSAAPLAMASASGTATSKILEAVKSTTLRPQ